MENRLSKIDPKEFGLNDTQVQTIEQAFMPKIVERDGLKTIYEQLITGEITPELCQQAYSLRNKLVKVRTGIADIHKTQKAFYLAAGRFVDEWKNKETLPVTQMEERLYEIESFYEKQEAERIEKLHKERLELLQPFIDETIFVPSDLGNMQADIWNNFFIGTKVSFEQKQAAIKKAEEERLEKERTEKIFRVRQLELLNLGAKEENGIITLSCKENIDYSNIVSINELATLSEEMYDNYKLEFIATVQANKEYDEKLRRENENLKLEAERKRELRVKRAGELQPYIIFIRDYDTLINSDEKEYKKQFSEIKIGAEQHWKYEREKQEKADKERKENELKLEAERKESQRLADELKAKKDAEEAARKAKELADKKAQAAPDKDKLTNAINSMEWPQLNLTTEQSKMIEQFIIEKFAGFKKWAAIEINKL